MGFEERVGVEVLATYTITAEDVAGTFGREIPEDLMEQATLDSLE